MACVKLYNEDNYDSFVRESEAYRQLKHRGVKKCIPTVFGTKEWPRWRWEGRTPEESIPTDGDELLFGLVMECFEDCETLHIRRATVPILKELSKGFARIHAAGVVHRDLDERNILLVRKKGITRVVWIDFSSAWWGFDFLPTIIDEWDMFRSLVHDRSVYPYARLC